jgi:mRNA interferase RelE/StbE
MNWRVVFARSAEKELSKLSSQMQIRVGRALRSLETDPFPPTAKRLKGREEFRIRVGDYRILYAIEHKSRLLTVAAIGHRRNVYR